MKISQTLQLNNKEDNLKVPKVRQNLKFFDVIYFVKNRTNRTLPRRYYQVHTTNFMINLNKILTKSIFYDHEVSLNTPK